MRVATSLPGSSSMPLKTEKNFLDEYVKELDKADDVREEMSGTCRTKNSSIYDNEDGAVQEEDKDDIDAKIDKL